jgi:protocatechuate 3,4-dioxygenase beta subunit
MSRLIALSLALITLAFSQSGGPRGRNVPVPAAEPVKPEDRCVIQGAVFSASNGEPLRKAIVRLNRIAEGGRGSGPQSTLSAMTDATGQYTISSIEPGRYRLAVERAGFVSQQYGVRAGTIQTSGTILNLAKGQKMSDLLFRLVPQGVITGRVFDEDGDPVQGVSVQCMRQVYVRGRKQWVPVNGQSTNDLGEYRMHSLPAGRYFVSATHRAVFMDSSEAGATDENYTATYYPGAISPDMATAIQVTPGAELRGIDIRLQKAPTVRVMGRVISGVTGGPVVNGSVRVVARGGAVLDVRPRMGRIDRNGNFVIAGITAGSYWLLADTMQDRAPLHGRVPIEVGSASIADLTLTLIAGAEIVGLVRTEGTDARPSGIRVQLEPKQIGLGGGSPSVSAGEDGGFTIRPVMPDAYFVRVSGVPDTHYIKSIQFGETDVTDGGVDFSQGIAPARLAITLASGAVQVSGAVQDARQQPATSAIVVLIPEGARREDPQHYRTTSTDQNGQYTLRGIPPGEYRLYAFDGIDPGVYMDPEFMKQYDRSGERVSARQNQQETVQLRVIEAGQ